MKHGAALRLGAGLVSLGLLAGTVPALATEGYFPLGFGTIQRGQGGTGVGLAGQDAMSLAINPAAIAGMETQMNLGAEGFMPFRGYDATGTGFAAPGAIDSGREFFLVPNFGYIRPLGNGTLGINVYGNGGMNTSYGNVANPNCGGGSGVFCAGPAGVDLMQMFVSVGYAHQTGAVRWGIAPTLAVQAFQARGLAAFGGMSIDPGNLTDRGQDFSYGIGIRLGAQVDIAPGLSLGLAGQTRFDMSVFDRYSGLFEGGGDFDIPAQISLGLAWQATPALTVMADAQRIYYSDVPAIGNAFGLGPLGAPGGTGFGWDDVNVFKLGFEWQQNDRMTWRAGYAHSSNPMGPEDVTIGILAPGIVEHHFSVGGTWRANARDSVDFAVVYVPEATLSGPEVTPGGVTPGSDIALRMSQVELSVGWTRRF